MDKNSITSARTFDEMQLLKTKLERAKDEEDVAIIIAGNKCDLAEHRQVQIADAEALGMCRLLLANSCKGYTIIQQNYKEKHAWILHFFLARRVLKSTLVCLLIKALFCCMCDMTLKIASSWGAKFYETSAKEKINNVEIFHECVRMIRRLDGEDEDSVVVTGDKKPTKMKRCTLL